MTEIIKIDVSILNTLNTVEIDSELSKEVTEQTVFFEKNKYYRGSPDIVLDEITKKVIGYLCPNGDRGYQVIFKKIIDGKEYSKSIGYGFEANSRSNDWTLIEKDG